MLRKALGMMAALPVVLGSVLGTPAGAAEPSTGTLDLKHKVVEWEGPLSVVGVNPVSEGLVRAILETATPLSACSGQPVVLECDTFELTVHIRGASYRSTGGVRVGITWGSGMNRYTLWVRDEAGNYVDSAGGFGSGNEEHVFIPVASGTYIIEVGSLVVVNDQYSGIAKLRGLKKLKRI